MPRLNFDNTHWKIIRRKAAVWKHEIRFR